MKKMGNDDVLIKEKTPKKDKTRFSSLKNNKYKET